jgi:transposase
MKIHSNAKLTPHSRHELSIKYQTCASISRLAEIYGVSRPTIYKWVKRQMNYQPLVDSSSRPNKIHTKFDYKIVEKATILRQLGMRLDELSAHFNIASSTLSRWINNNLVKKPPSKFVGLYPGHIIHTDAFTLQSFIAPGKNHLNKGGKKENFMLAIDSYTRLAYCVKVKDQTKQAACKFLLEAKTFYEKHDITIERLHSDNGSCYRSKMFNKLLQRQHIKHSYNKPYRPQTNGKAERLVRTIKTEWAYSQIYDNSQTRNDQLASYMKYYNQHRQHKTLKMTPTQMCKQPIEN